MSTTSGAPTREDNYSQSHTNKSESNSTIDLETLRNIVKDSVEELSPSLRVVNQGIHSRPETAYKEVYAHETLTDFLEEHDFVVERHAWGLSTAFDATFGSGGRQIVLCAEYDALPNIGHACGHNLIATSSLAAAIAAAAAIKELNIPGRIRVLGTPAEEGGGGKIDLIRAGAFEPPEDIAAAIMAHPVGSSVLFERLHKEWDGIAGVRFIASYKMRVEFRGHSAHAGGDPWNGVNALDAAVAAYNNVSMLRQQIRNDERIHGVIEHGGTVPNVVPDYTRMNWSTRSPNLTRCNKLVTRVKACLEAGAKATGCDISYDILNYYMDLRVNRPLCKIYVEEMSRNGREVIEEIPAPKEATTDMGNVSYVVPSFHGFFAIPTTPGVSAHNANFTECAGTDGSHDAAIDCARGLAMLAIRVLIDDAIAEAAWVDFDRKETD